MTDEERRAAEMRSIMKMTKSTIDKINEEEKPAAKQPKKQTKGAKK